LLRLGKSAWVKAGAVALCVLFLDLGTKAFVSDSLGLYEKHELLPFIALLPVHNPGLSLTFFEGGIHLPIYVLFAVVLFVTFFIARYPPSPLLWLPTGFLLGGALGNLLDRMHQGYVTDFIQIHGWRQVFNFADLSLALGLVLLFALSIWGTVNEVRDLEISPTPIPRSQSSN
jgi:signal peptidase II